MSNDCKKEVTTKSDVRKECALKVNELCNAPAGRFRDVLHDIVDGVLSVEMRITAFIMRASLAWRTIYFFVFSLTSISGFKG